MSPPRWSGSELPPRVPSSPPRTRAQPADEIPTLEGEGEEQPAGKERRGVGAVREAGAAGPALSERPWENVRFRHAKSRVNWLWMQHAQKKREGFLIFYMNQTQKRLLEK